jgi:hypothetical protein
MNIFKNTFNRSPLKTGPSVQKMQNNGRSTPENDTLLPAEVLGTSSNVSKPKEAGLSKYLKSTFKKINEARLKTQIAIPRLRTESSIRWHQLKGTTEQLESLTHGASKEADHMFWLQGMGALSQDKQVKTLSRIMSETNNPLTLSALSTHLLKLPQGPHRERLTLRLTQRAADPLLQANPIFRMSLDILHGENPFKSEN